MKLIPLRKQFFSTIILLLFTLLAACQKELDSSSDDVTAVNTSNAANTATVTVELSREQIFTKEAIQDFTLLDHKGKSHQLFNYSDARAIVIMIQGNGCPVVRNSLKDFSDLAEQYKKSNIQFFMLNSNLQDDRDAVAKEAGAWDITVPVLIDEYQIVGRDLGLSRTAEILIIDPRERQIVYRGPLHDRVSYERQSNKPDVHYTQLALDALLAGNPIPKALAPVKGCLINFPKFEKNVSYQSDIAPMLIEHCVACHQDGGIAPWAMNSHAMVQGFAPMIKEVIRTRRMPPYDADPHIGKWQQNPLLDKDQLRQLLAWIENGAIKEGELDPLKEYKSTVNEWAFGKPDLIVEIPAFEIPATGILEYRYAQVENPYDRDVWLVGTAIQPGDPLALHHLKVGVATADFGNGEGMTEDYLMVWAPGTNVGYMPEGTGVLLPKNSRFLFEMHYTAYGKASVDQSSLGLYFLDKPPAKTMRFGEVADVFLKIPPYRRSYADKSYTVFDHDATIYMLAPHAHFRGKSFKFVYRYPNGEEELALSVPTYDFNWQRGYYYQQPKKVPAGTMLVVSAEFDNSIFNEANPDPTSTVTWGAQSEDEMLLGAFTFSWDDETIESPIHDGRKWVINKRFGYFDVNMDGRVLKSEMPADRRRSFDFFLRELDSNKDQAITLDEWHAKPEVDFY